MSTGPLHDLGLTEKRTGPATSVDACCGGGSCGGGGCGGMCGSEPSGAQSSGGNASGGCGSAGGCACSAAAPTPTVRADTVIGAPRVTGARARVSSVLEVTGMTRARCIVTVMNAVERITGVDSVTVDLNSGGVSLVSVISSGDLDPVAVRRAIDESGYTLVGDLVPAR